MAKKSKKPAANKKPMSPTIVKMRNMFAKAFPTIAKAAGTSPQTIDNAQSVLPRVNLLPPSLVLEVRRRFMVRAFAVITSLIALGMAGIWFAQGTEIQIATTQVEAREFETSLARAEVDRLKPIGAYFDQLQGRINTATLMYMEQADYTGILAGIQAATPDGVVINDISIEFVSPSSGAAPTCGSDTSPYLDQTVRPLGCISFSGTARDTTALTAFIKAVESVDTVLYPFIAPGSAGAAGEVTFTGTAAISPAASVAEAAAELVDVKGIEGLTPTRPNETDGGPPNE
jgi:Tfp pilus assembly protein PilN